jgi:acyl dehydratase
MPLSTAMVGKSTRRFRHHVDARWLMSYAAGLGETAACYFDTTQRLASHPASHPLFPVCIEWPVVLDSRNIEGARHLTVAESARGVHATHDLQIHRPIEAGEDLFTVGTVIAVEARRPGAYQLTRFETTDASHKPVATTYQGSLYRGVAVDGGSRAIGTVPPLPPPSAAAGSDSISVSVPANAAHVYTECARIWNPIHTDRVVALAAGLPDIILHGTATLALAVSALIGRRLGGDPRRVSRIVGRFAAMVSMPNELTVRIEGSDAGGIWFDVGTRQGDIAIRDGFLGVASR